VSILAELWTFLRERKKLWLLPIIVLMLILGAAMVVLQSTALAPFLYSFF
jgi:drug/metabolite transporter superfamily protein YnfA